nr:hypothetical protein [uncultured Holophaga sp.]
MTESSSFRFQPGDRVRLTAAGIALYGGVAQWVPEAQGGGTAGTVLVAAERPHRPGAAPRPYYVVWDNGAENSYREEDLEEAVSSEAGRASSEEPGNIIQVKWGKS